MKKKYTILTIGLMVFFVSVYFFYTPSISDSDFKEKNTDHNYNETTRVKDDVDLIEYLNLEAENRKLIKKIDTLETEIFEFYKAFIDPESNEIMPYFKNLNALTVYKEVSEDEIILLVRNETDNSYTLSIASKEIGYENTLTELKNNEIINYSVTDGIYSGLIKGNEINAITVKENEKSYEAEIVNFTDNTSFWYTIYDYKRKLRRDNLDKMKIEAYDKNGKVIWEDSFDGDLGG